jgi:hypothetical protein
MAPVQDAATRQVRGNIRRAAVRIARASLHRCLLSPRLQRGHGHKRRRESRHQSQQRSGDDKHTRVAMASRVWHREPETQQRGDHRCEHEQRRKPRVPPGRQGAIRDGEDYCHPQRQSQQAVLYGCRRQFDSGIGLSKTPRNGSEQLAAFRVAPSSCRRYPPSHRAGSWCPKQ